MNQSFSLLTADPVRGEAWALDDPDDGHGAPAERPAHGVAIGTTATG
ncbi:MAG: hypothetical protein AVDCRST_MAG19-4300 [uncultured Thermomicrobiales bacterium]|uniref:Uncharacterized protein n=1 Tax=uncultured Thermomicrobiales bacterium TaxID=1645740 RepID=A0A6J4VN96_9BACT|nr:MAG: hypothetical protein AVDCRST_MAG19-4300 [uncultured Thermomicrobiales bacterium]